jgi:NIPSNAP
VVNAKPASITLCSMSVYCIARITIRYGKIAEFVDAMQRLVPIMEENGWRLHASYQTIIGNLHEAYDIWELPSADAVGAGLVAAAADSRFPEIAPDLAAAIESETLSIVTKTPFSP